MSFNSDKYWEDRYKNNGNSGCGSYNHLAAYKADVINTFIKTYNIQSVIDHGVGDGNQLKLLNTEALQYTGIDVSPTIITHCKSMFKDDVNKQFFHTSAFDSTMRSELVLSCDVLYHLINDTVYYNYIKQLFTYSTKYVIIYANNTDLNHAPHVKFRKFTDYIEKTYPAWKLIKYMANPYKQTIIGQQNDTTSPSDFYIYEYTLTSI